MVGFCRRSAAYYLHVLDVDLERLHDRRPDKSAEILSQAMQGSMAEKCAEALGERHILDLTNAAMDDCRPIEDRNNK